MRTLLVAAAALAAVALPVDSAAAQTAHMGGGRHWSGGSGMHWQGGNWNRGHWRGGNVGRHWRGGNWNRGHWRGHPGRVWSRHGWRGGPWRGRHSRSVVIVGGGFGGGYGWGWGGYADPYWGGYGYACRTLWWDGWSWRCSW